MKSNIKRFLSVLCLSASVLSTLSFSPVSAVLSYEEGKSILHEFDKMGTENYYSCIKTMKEVEGKLTAKQAFILLVYRCMKGKSRFMLGVSDLGIRDLGVSDSGISDLGINDPKDRWFKTISRWLVEENFDEFLVRAKEYIEKYLNEYGDASTIGCMETEKQTLRVLNEVIEGKKDLEEAISDLNPDKIYGIKMSIPKELEKAMLFFYVNDSKLNYDCNTFEYCRREYEHWHKVIIDLVKNGKLSKENAFKLMMGKVFYAGIGLPYSAEQIEDRIILSLAQKDYTEFYEFYNGLKKTTKRRLKYDLKEGNVDDLSRCSFVLYRADCVMEQLKKGCITFDDAYNYVVTMFKMYDQPC